MNSRNVSFSMRFIKANIKSNLFGKAKAAARNDTHLFFINSLLLAFNGNECTDA
jgi:hypothetical protein